MRCANRNRDALKPLLLPDGTAFSRSAFLLGLFFSLFFFFFFHEYVKERLTFESLPRVFCCFSSFVSRSSHKKPTLKTTLAPQHCLICLRWRFTCAKKTNISSRIYPRLGVQIVNYGKHGLHDAWMEISRVFFVVVFFLHAPLLFALLCSVWNVLPLSKHTRAAVYWCFCFIAMFIDVCVSVWCVLLPLLLGFSAARNGAIRWMEYCHKPPSDHLFTSMHFSWKMKGHERKL